MKHLPKRKARPTASKRVCNIEVDGEMLCVYPLDDVMQELGKRRTLLLVGALGRGRRRFHEIQEDLAGVSSRTLSERLKALDELGTVEREAFNEVPSGWNTRSLPKGSASWKRLFHF